MVLGTPLYCKPNSFRRSSFLLQTFKPTAPLKYLQPSVDHKLLQETHSKFQWSSEFFVVHPTEPTVATCSYIGFVLRFKVPVVIPQLKQQAVLSQYL